MEQNKKQAILIGAGDVSGGCIQIEKEDLVIALDGGLLFCAENDITPDYIIGDFDSLPIENQTLLERYPQDCIRRLPCEKDDTESADSC